ncbi:MAG: hypothetical protein H6937_03690 [Burkholderiales bacterium]|nr:hypothetical protein [Burkholderiales bacterium]MDR4518674.1 hypothetical protein [Nitrosomonas sp.]
MRNLFFLLIIIMSLPLTASGTETLRESVQDATNDAKREAKQQKHRLEEAACMKSETECLKQKTENRLEESTDAVVDKYNEIKNVIDDD